MALNTNDQTANANHLTNNNGVTEVTTSLPFAQSTAAADFEKSSSQSLSITDAAQNGALDITGNITFEAWVKIEQLPSTAGEGFMIVCKWDIPGNQRAYEFLISTDDKLYVDWSQDGGGTNYSRFSMDETFVSGDIGNWIHVAAVCTVATPTVVFYKNGVAKAGTAASVAATAIFNSTAIFAVGVRAETTDSYLDGILDDVRVWNTTRTAGQIAANYNIELVGNESGLAFYLPFEDTISSVSPSASPSVSPSVSVSPSKSPSLSPSVSPSVSTSPSVSPSSSLSPSASPSVSPSSSSSPSASPSVSPSASSSPSVSPSVSTSPSVSASPSVSPSPSPGYTLYSRGDLSSLPTNRDDLETLYSIAEEEYVSERDDIRVGQTGALQYMIHEFKTYVGAVTRCSIQWEGQSTLAPGSSTVYMQIYNESLGVWETIDYNTEAQANVDFELCAKIADLSLYKDGDTVISCRVYQLAT